MIICGGDGRCAAVEEDDEEEEEEGEGGRSGRFESENHSKRFQNYTHLYMIYIYVIRVNKDKSSRFKVYSDKSNNSLKTIYKFKKITNIYSQTVILPLVCF